MAGMKKHRVVAPIVAAILLLLPVLYVGSYLALVEPGPRNGWGNARYRTYRVSDEFCVRFFWPVEQIDKRVRPRAWESPWGEFGPLQD